MNERTPELSPAKIDYIVPFYLQVLQRFNVDMKGVDCGDLIDLVMKWSRKRQHADEKINNKSSLLLMAIGGEIEGNSVYSSIEYYSPRFQKWKYWRNFPDARVHYGVAVVDNHLYIIGGELNGECLNSVRIARARCFF